MVGGIRKITAATITKGVTIIAHNSGDIDYVGIAAWSAKRIQKYLNLPVTLITSTPTKSPVDVFDKIIFSGIEENGSRFFEDSKTSIPWLNKNRYRVFDLSPYDHTLLLDADYVVSSDRLNQLFSCGKDLVTHRFAYDVTGTRDFRDLNWFGRYQMPMAWATVICFRRCHHSKLVFDMMSMIQENWTHYRNLYSIHERRYRNDYALAIALNTVNGHTGEWSTIPWSMATVEPTHKISIINDDEFRVDFIDNNQKNKYIIVRNQDFHAMGKKNLGEIIAN